jgi:membrane-bound lytic murein transglycosylase B
MGPMADDQRRQQSLRGRMRPQVARKILQPIAGLGLMLMLAAPSATVAAPAFEAWVDTFRGEALAQGVNPTTLDRAFAGVRPLPKVIEFDRRQPEFTQAFWQYLDNRISDERVRRGRRVLADHARLLDRVAQRYGVPPGILVSFWALESNFGDTTGDFPLVAALATLAHDGRRSEFFRQQLMAALTLMEQGDLPFRAAGSWAGALGQPQFMPTTYRDYAVDFDGDGRRDLWRSLPDIFASAANYLAASGWQRGQTWGREVQLPGEFDYASADLDNPRPVAEWRQWGVRDAFGGDLAELDGEAAVILPGGVSGGPALMVYPNFRTILTWNRSVLYAVAVGHLADRFAGGAGFAAPRPDVEEQLSRSNVVEMQVLLTRLGLDAGDADGVVGPRTREAIRAFQQQSRLPADGFPTFALLEQLRLSASN